MLVLPSQIPPSWALLPNIQFDRHAETLIAELTATLETRGCSPIDARSFVITILSCLCQDGTAQGIAMRPRQEHVSPQRGQKRIVAPSHLVPRASVNQPIIRIVARQLVEESNREHGHEPPPILLELLEILAMRIDALANEPNWKNILTQPPDYQRNRVFELHYELGGYPAFNLFAAQLHRGLIAHIREVESETNEVRDQILRATLTAPRALIPVIPESWLRTVTAKMSANYASSFKLRRSV